MQCYMRVCLVDAAAGPALVAAKSSSRAVVDHVVAIPTSPAVFRAAAE